MRIALLFALCIPLFAQTKLSPEQVPWKQVDLTCAGLPSPGTTIKDNQINWPDPAVYFQIDKEKFPFSMAGPFSPKPEPNLFSLLNIDPINMVRPDCRAFDLAMNAAFVIRMKCTRCHGDVGPPPDTAFTFEAFKGEVGDLDMRTRASILRGGKHGPAMKPGDPYGSRMIWYIIPRTTQENSNSPWEVPVGMPPGYPLESNEIKALIDWVAAGAPDFR